MAEKVIMSNAVREREGLDRVKPAGVKTVVRDKPMRRRVAEAFVSDERGNIKDHVIFDVVIPAIKNAICDVITDGITMFLFGDKKRRRVGDGPVRTSYGSFWASSITETNRRTEVSASPARSSMGRYMDAAWESKDEANEVLDQMTEIFGEYKVLTVADFFGLIDDPKNFPIESVHNKWGWKSLSEARVEKVGSGLWGITLPRPQHLD